ncbi:MAG TPA: response regulator transcription factor [Euzebyales bacterium]|nr:response regulator transcription factor [Euzebyales bacterium]
MRLLILSDGDSAKTLLPALEFLDHSVAVAPLHPREAPDAHEADLVVIDATDDLGAASSTCRSIVASDRSRPVLVVVDEGGLAAIKSTWGFDDWLLPRARPAELETRLRLLAENARNTRSSRARIGDLSIDEETYVVRLRGKPLDLTFREFELLKYLANNPGRVFTRSQLLQEVWGYDYFGGTRTVDVHIRRLRAKLGTEHEQLIGTVRGVGYKLDPAGSSSSGETP